MRKNIPVFHEHRPCRHHMMLGIEVGGANEYMVNTPHSAQAQTIFQLEPYEEKTLMKVRDHTHEICKRYTGRYVRIRTVSGEIYEGTIVGVDHRHLYLQVSSMAGDYGRAFYPAFFPFYYGNVILPLVLFELLTISLLY